MLGRLEDYIGKEVYVCDHIGGKLNIDVDTYSFCHRYEIGAQRIPCTGQLTPALYRAAVADKIEENFRETAPCRACSKCKKKVYVPTRLSYVVICGTWYCNSNCVYCWGSKGEQGQGISPLNKVKEYYEEGMFEQDCLFDWGGGEPTLTPGFGETVRWINNHGFRQRINTNGILYSEETEQALRDERCTLRISVDAGTKEMFCRVKGHDKYEEVWENIGRYASVSEEVYIKYNIFHWNSDLREADAFLDNCVKHNVKKIYVESEHNGYGKRNNVGPFFFREKELSFAKYLYTAAETREIHPYVASGFADRSSESKKCLPEVLNSNVDYEKIKNGIIPETFATVKELAEHVRSGEVVIWGVRIFGKKVKSSLEKFDVTINAFVDCNSSLQELRVEGLEVLSPEDAAKGYKDAYVILAGNNYESMVAQANANNWKQWKDKMFYLFPSKYI